MKFDAETLQMFLKDKPFYKNSECFCLGSSLEDAGNIMTQIIEDNKCERRTGDVGMDNN